MYSLNSSNATVLRPIHVISIIFISFILITCTHGGAGNPGTNPAELGTRAEGSLTFTEISSGLPTTGEYNYIAFGDFNKDDEIDIAFGGEDWALQDTTGLYAYTGNGGSSWTSASDGLWTDNSWGGLAMADADEDGYIELYAPDEHWGSNSNAGVKVWEYRSGSWTDSKAQVSTPLMFGQPNNVAVQDITGDSRPDIVVCKRTGIEYYENNGGNPVNWKERSDGLSTSFEFTAAAVEDINDDGLMDIITADYSGNEYIYVQSSSGTLWNDYSDTLDSGGTSLGVTVGDVNNDNNMDLIFGNAEGGLRCWLGNGGGISGTNFHWTNSTEGLPLTGSYVQVQLGDIDNDDDLDLIAPEGGGTRGIQIFLGNGNTNSNDRVEWDLASSTNLPSSGMWYGAGLYDINSDGALDIVGASWGLGIKAWLNNINKPPLEFNLRITEDNVAFSSDPVIIGESFTITATVENIGELDALDFSVRFKMDDQQLGNDKKISLLKSGDDVQITKSWTATEGVHTVIVDILADPLLEADNSDNSIEIAFTPVEKVEDNTDTTNKTGSGNTPTMFFLFIIIIIIVSLIVIFLLSRRKKEPEPVEAIPVEVEER